MNAWKSIQGYLKVKFQNARISTSDMSQEVFLQALVDANK